MFTVFPRLNVILSCFKQLPLNCTCILLPVYFSVGAKLLDVVGGLIISSDNPLDSHNVHFQYCQSC